MKRIFTLFLMAGICLAGYTQSGNGDFWLNHGFSSGTTVLTNLGTFYDDGGADIYQGGQDWAVRFCSENGNPISVDFDHFRTIYIGGDYHNSDYLLINYTGAGIGYVAYDFDTPQFSFTSPDGCIDFTFHSNALSVRDSGWVAGISANPPPVNNDQCSAIELSVGNVCSPSFFTNKGAWDTRGLGKPSCHKFFGGDVWFTAAIPPSGQLKIETFEGSLKNAVMVLYSGSCTSLHEITCEYNGAMPVKTITGTPGDVIYIRMFGDQARSGTFGICATDPFAPITGFTGPGGVGDSLSNELWLKADRGVIRDDGQAAADGDNVRIWKDQSGNHADAQQLSSANQALFSANVPGGMPALGFDGANDRYTGELGTLSAPLTIFTVNRFNNVLKDQSVMVLGDASATNSTSFGRENDNRYYSLTGSKLYGPVINALENNIFEVNHQIVSPFQQLKINGTPQTLADYSAALSTDGSLVIGSTAASTAYFDGDLSELIFYSKNVNKAQEIIITNYLAAKYNTGIGAADRYAYQDSHRYDVAGIGRVDAQNIHSKAQSNGILTIGGASDLEDGEFLLFGHDGGDISAWTSAETPESDPNVIRIMREWRVDQTGGNGSGSVTLGLSTGKLPALPADFLAFNLLVDDDGNFTEGADAYGLVKSGDEYLANNVDLPDGSFITIVAIKPYIQFDSASSAGPESTEHPSFSVSLNYAVSAPVEVNYSISSGTATGGGVDYSLNAGVISFIPGQKTQEIIPLIVNDTLVEIPDEYFEVELSNPTAGILLGSEIHHIYTIQDDDLAINIHASDTITGHCSSSFAWLYAEASGQGPFTWSWSPSDSLSDPTNDTTKVNPSVTTDYTLIVTDRNGHSEQRSVRIYVRENPQVPVITPGGTLDLCTGDSLILTSDSAFSYLWSTGETERSIVAKSGGDYYLSTMDESGCTSSSSEPVTVNVLTTPIPVLTALTDTVLCDGDSVKLESSDAAAYFWSDGSGSKVVSITASGMFSLHTQDVNGCFSEESRTIKVIVHSLPDKPVITPSGSVGLCEGGTVVLRSTAPSGVTYLWSDGSSDDTLSISAVGLYSLFVSDENGCQSPESDQVQVTTVSLPEKPVIEVSGELSFCEGGSVELTSPVAQGYAWSTGETTNSILVNTSESVMLSIEGSSGCLSPESDPVVVAVFPAPEQPVITPAGEVTILTGDSLLLSSSPADGYLWSTGELSKEIFVRTDGNYSVTAVSEEGCQSEPSESTLIIVSDNLPKPMVSIEGGTEFCEGQSVVLTAESASAYLWSDGQTSRSITVGESGSYTLVITNEFGVQSLESDPVEINVHSNPIPSLETTDVPCFGGSDGTAMVTVFGGLEPYGFDWSGGMTGQSVSGLSAGTITVVVTDANTCVGSDTAVLDQPEEILVGAVVNNAACPEASDGSIITNVTGGISPYIYEWSESGSGIGSPSNLAPGSYQVVVTDMNNCSSAADFTVNYNDELCFRIPEIITPNGDGLNDTWEIEGLALYPGTVVEIYDRWGKRIFYSRGYDQPWDGTFNGKELPMESYHYVINMNNGKKPVIGNITIVR